MFVPIPLFEHQRMGFSEISPKEIADRFFNDNEFVSNIEHFLEKNELERVLSFDRKHLKESVVYAILYKAVGYKRS